MAHVLRGMSWGACVDTTTTATTSEPTIATGGPTAVDGGSGSALGGHLSVVLDLIVHQSLREKEKRETSVSSSSSSPSLHHRQQPQQQPRHPVLSITSRGATVSYSGDGSNKTGSSSSSKSPSSNSGSNNSISSNSSSVLSDYVDMGATRALSSALVTSLCRQGI